MPFRLNVASKKSREDTSSSKNRSVRRAPRALPMGFNPPGPRRKELRQRKTSGPQAIQMVLGKRENVTRHPSEIEFKYAERLPKEPRTSSCARLFVQALLGDNLHPFAKVGEILSHSTLQFNPELSAGHFLARW